MGSGSSIGADVVIAGSGTLTIGDHVRIHRLVFINCHSDIDIGHNSWIGEKSVIDGTARLRIGNNVGIGVGSQIWTHISFGDAFSGCRLRNSTDVTLADEAWLCGPVLLQSCGVASRAVVMGGSNVINDITSPNTIWAGNPAVDVTDLMGGPPWRDTSPETRLRTFQRLLRKFGQETTEDWTHGLVGVLRMPPKGEQNPLFTYFEMTGRTYTKTGDRYEQEFITWMLKHNKAKFTPVPR
jgi:carbonic anhydrase/acetyltransferase-like protein (isoleucine patch superfamily)